MTYRKFNAPPPSRAGHLQSAGLAVAALAGCLAVAHPAPAFAQEAREAAPARNGAGLLRALGLGQPEDARAVDEAPERDAGAVAVAAAPPSAKSLYRVAPGDTLASIARRIEGASVDWRGLCAANTGRIADCDALRAGDVIVIPDGGRIGATGSSPRADIDAGAPPPRVVAASPLPAPRPAVAASSASDAAPSEVAGEAVSGPSAITSPQDQPGGVTVAGIADTTEQSPAWQGIGGPLGLTVRLRSAPTDDDGQRVRASAATLADGAGSQGADKVAAGGDAVGAEAREAGEIILTAATSPQVAAPSPDENAAAEASVDDAQSDAVATASENASYAGAVESVVTTTTPNAAGDATAPEAHNTPPPPDAPRAIAELRYGAGYLPMSLRSYHLHGIEAVAGGVRVWGHVPGLYSTGTTGGAFQRLEDGFEARAAGQTVRVSVTMSGPAGGIVAVAYSTNDLGNSGWRTFELKPEPTTHRFDYTLPPLVNGNGDFVGIDPDPEGAGHAVTIHAIHLEILEGNPA